ncbi:MAG: hypothetical protein ABIF71_10890 [Planctomycetota bacterium]
MLPFLEFLIMHPNRFGSGCSDEQAGNLIELLDSIDTPEAIALIHIAGFSLNIGKDTMTKHGAVLYPQYIAWQARMSPWDFKALKELCRAQGIPWDLPPDIDAQWILLPEGKYRTAAKAFDRIATRLTDPTAFNASFVPALHDRLVVLLDAPDPHIRIEALQALIGFGLEQPQYAQAFLCKDDPDLAIAAASVLLYAGDRTFIRDAVSRNHGPVTGVRLEAVRILSADFLIPAENALALFGVSQARESTIGRFGWLP